MTKINVDLNQLNDVAFYLFDNTFGKTNISVFVCVSWIKWCWQWLREDIKVYITGKIPRELDRYYSEYPNIVKKWKEILTME